MTNDTQHSSAHPLPQYVTGERIIIRPTTRADAPYLHQWWNNPAIMGPSGTGDGMQNYDEADVDAWFRRHIDNRKKEPRHFVICRRDGDQTPIGEFYISCDDRPGCVTFSISIGDTSLWGQGYASEAVLAYAAAVFEDNCCGAMRLDIPVNNTRAMRMAEAIGFQLEHTWANGLKRTLILTRDAFEMRRASLEKHS
ncbi:MAG TPA: GNAT family N-acetyltransferase [Aggregatilinea sp.]|uniref:GNAT family N-acetyltransferase n=1 Tax=Aggregatilinea sp. TaxID=2806333 RepID=UPI002CCB65DE|nr:GNAT family N-acetyltransferase [Aggregatilinea sp.]HML24987.1 GNAT family N-acetyltransferase [Aggregatilinea sp.]